LKAYSKEQKEIKNFLLAKLDCGEGELVETLQEAARKHYSSDGEVDFDDGAVVSLSDEMGDGITGLRGAYVQAWVFVRMSELTEELQREHGAKYTCDICKKTFHYPGSDNFEGVDEYSLTCEERHGAAEEVKDGS